MGKTAPRQTIKSGVVHKVPCGHCDATYIGETGRKRSTRLKEHKGDVAKATHATPCKTELVEHCWTTGHAFDFSNATTLAREQSNGG
uniref:Tick transposon n=1 Tax=Rhipicephalus appendiculatus TaxID=34631 RepID=A0A131YEL2_RHIAP